MGEPRGVVDCHMEEVVAHAPARPEAIAGDAVADLAEAGELLDVEVQELARPLALIADDRRRQLQASAGRGRAASAWPPQWSG